MKLFLTSSIGGSYIENRRRIPCALDKSNHFMELLKEYWPDNARCLMISSDPENDLINDSFQRVFSEAVRLSGLSLMKMDVCDKRNEDEIADILYGYDVLLLTGGHVPTQNLFLQRIRLKELIRSFDGIVIGMSAGSMNCADTVYAQPELDGEAVDKEYNRYLDGLGLTDISILPHFQELEDLTLDGLRIIEDISLPDSKTRPFYALPDGSYIFINGSEITLYGEAYWVRDGVITKVCDNESSISL